MKKACLKAGLLSVILLPAFQANAQFSDPYVIAGISNIKEADTGDSENGLNVIVGGEFNDYFGFEGALYHAKFGGTVSGVEIDTTALALTFTPVAHYDVTENFRVLAKAGVAYGFLDVEGCQNKVCHSASEDEAAFVYGAGLQYNEGKVAVRLSYDKYSGEVYDFNVISLSVGGYF